GKSLSPQGFLFLSGSPLKIVRLAYGGRGQAFERESMSLYLKQNLGNDRKKKHKKLMAHYSIK
ncbi:MAG: hypothetical protein WA162_03850, partial [Thermodesulfobacteriota bacterium]